MKVGGRWGHRKSGGLPVGRVEPVESAGEPVAYSSGPHPRILPNAAHTCRSAAL